MPVMFEIGGFVARSASVAGFRFDFAGRSAAPDDADRRGQSVRPDQSSRLAPGAKPPVSSGTGATCLGGAYAEADGYRR
jgi:hypothetical protein